MMQKAVQQFLKDVNGYYTGNLEDKYELIVEYWHAIQKIFPDEWREHRHHLITKGVGLYSLMMLLSSIIKARPQDFYDEKYFVSQLNLLKERVDWSSNGTFANAGGHKGAKDAHQTLKGFLNI